jgi:molybdate transport system substrate-binding protein
MSNAPDAIGWRLSIINHKGPTMITFSLPTATAVRGTIIMVAMMLNSPTVAAAELNVLMSGGFGGAYEKLLPEFERTSGVKVTTRSGASQGSGPQTIAAQLARGVPADVVILSREGLTELIAANKITGGTDVNLAQVPLGIAVRAKAPKPDVSTVAAFKQTMTKAKKIALPGSTSGIWLKNDLFPRLGIADKISIEMKPRGTDVTNMVATGDADIGVLPVSEILVAAGVDYGGTLPSEIQLVQVFAAAVVADSKESVASKQLIEFLASPRATEAIKSSGMELLATSR